MLSTGDILKTTPKAKLDPIQNFHRLIKKHTIFIGIFWILVPVIAFFTTCHQNWQFLNFCNVNLGPVESLASWQCDVHSSTEASLVNRANIVIHTDQSHIRQVTQEHFEFFLNDPNFWGTHFFSTPDNYIGPAKGQTSGWERVKMSHYFDSVRLKYYKEIMWMTLVFVKSNCHKWPGLRFINWTKELKSTCYLTIRQYQHI